MTPAIGSTALIFVVEAAVRALVFAGVVALALKVFRVSSAAVIRRSCFRSRVRTSCWPFRVSRSLRH